MNGLLAAWWVQLWPNLAASLICVGTAYLRLKTAQERQHLAQIAHQNRLHEALKAHITAAAAGGGRGNRH